MFWKCLLVFIVIGPAHRLPLPLPLAPHILPSSSWTRRPTSRKPSAKPTLIFWVWNPTLWHALSSLSESEASVRQGFGLVHWPQTTWAVLQFNVKSGQENFQDVVENFYIVHKVKFAANTSNWGRCPIILKTQSLQSPEYGIQPNIYCCAPFSWKHYLN